MDEAAALAEADYEYRKIEIKGISDSVQDVIESIQGKGLAGRKERVALASSAEEADLVVEIRARRSGKTLPTQLKADRCYLLFSLGPGGKLDAERFAEGSIELPAGKFGYAVWKLASPKPESPVFLFESYNGGGSEFGCHGAAANAAAVAIDSSSRTTGRCRRHPERVTYAISSWYSQPSRFGPLLGIMPPCPTSPSILATLGPLAGHFDDVRVTAGNVEAHGWMLGRNSQDGCHVPLRRRPAPRPGGSAARPDVARAHPWIDDAAGSGFSVQRHECPSADGAARPGRLP